MSVRCREIEIEMGIGDFRFPGRKGDKGQVDRERQGGDIIP